MVGILQTNPIAFDELNEKSKNGDVDASRNDSGNGEKIVYSAAKKFDELAISQRTRIGLKKSGMRHHHVHHHHRVHSHHCVHHHQRAHHHHRAITITVSITTTVSITITYYNN